MCTFLLSSRFSDLSVVHEFMFPDSGITTDQICEYTLPWKQLWTSFLNYYHDGSSKSHQSPSTQVPPQIFCMNTVHMSKVFLNRSAPSNWWYNFIKTRGRKYKQEVNIFRHGKRHTTSWQVKCMQPADKFIQSSGLTRVLLSCYHIYFWNRKWIYYYVHFITIHPLKFNLIAAALRHLLTEFRSVKRKKTFKGIRVFTGWNVGMEVTGKFFSSSFKLQPAECHWRI